MCAGLSEVEVEVDGGDLNGEEIHDEGEKAPAHLVAHETACGHAQSSVPPEHLQPDLEVSGQLSLGAAKVSKASHD